MTDKIINEINVSSDNTCLELLPIDYKAAFFTLSRKVSLVKLHLANLCHESAERQLKEAIDLIDAVEKTANTFQIKANYSKKENN